MDNRKTILKQINIQDQSEENVLERFSAQIGELALHQLSHDEKTVEVSDWYYGLLAAVLNRNPVIQERKTRKYLEIACYRHILGNKLTKDRGFESTHFDISDRDLLIGQETALKNNLPTVEDLVAGDFHDLPFADNYFDLVMISASIHHTRSPHKVIEEVMRVLTDGGLFYSQREPCERLFCFYKFNANRPAQCTPFERHLHDKDIMHLISSPHPGARNAEMFGRIENDHIPLELYYDVFSRYGTVLEQVLYFDGLLTRMDKEILSKACLSENKLSEYIFELVNKEILLAKPLLSIQDEHLGYSLPSENEIKILAEKTATALKARPKDEKSVEWQKAMVKIFGGSLRFVVQRDRNDKKRSSVKFRRSCESVNGVKRDSAIYENSGLSFWDKLLPDLQTADVNIFNEIFSSKYWRYYIDEKNIRMMMSTTSAPVVSIKLPQPALVVMRYEVVIDGNFSVGKLLIRYDGQEVCNEMCAQSEHRMLRFVYNPAASDIFFELKGLDGVPAMAENRIRISILQCIPIREQNLNGSPPTRMM